jgi:hypothetical protein
MLRNSVSGRHATFRRGTTVKYKTMAIIFALVLVAGAVTLTLSLSQGTTSVSASSARSEELHVTKECSAYTGAAGAYCTITGSNLPDIEPGSQFLYSQAGVDPTTPEGRSIGLDSSAVLYVGPGDWAVGRCILDGKGNSGLCTFSDGIGRLTGLRARVVVSSTDGVNYNWNGTCSFSPVPEREN